MPLVRHGFFNHLYLDGSYSSYEIDEQEGSIIFPVAGYSKSIDGVSVQPYIKQAYADKTLGKPCHSSLTKDNKNGYDPWAIRVEYNGHDIGWVPKTISERVSLYLPHLHHAQIVEVKIYSGGFCQAFLKVEYSLPKGKTLISKEKIEEEEKKEQNSVVDSFLADMLNAIME